MFSFYYSIPHKFALLQFSESVLPDKHFPTCKAPHNDAYVATKRAVAKSKHTIIKCQ